MSNTKSLSASQSLLAARPWIAVIAMEIEPTYRLRSDGCTQHGARAGEGAFYFVAVTRVLNANAKVSISALEPNSNMCEAIPARKLHCQISWVHSLSITILLTFKTSAVSSSNDGTPLFTALAIHFASISFDVSPVLLEEDESRIKLRCAISPRYVYVRYDKSATRYKCNLNTINFAFRCASSLKCKTASAPFSLK